MPSTNYFHHSRSRGERPTATFTEALNVRVSPELMERLASVGNREGYGLSDTVRLVLERGLAASERKGR